MYNLFINDTGNETDIDGLSRKRIKLFRISNSKKLWGPKHQGCDQGQEDCSWVALFTY